MVYPSGVRMNPANSTVFWQRAKFGVTPTSGAVSDSAHAPKHFHRKNTDQE